MIITGLRILPSVVGDGMFVCPVCRAPEGYLHIQHTRWFTFFFMPVFPIKRVGEHVECQNCRSQFAPAVVQAATSDAAVVAALAENFGIEDATVFREHTLSPAANRPTLHATPARSGLALISLIAGLVSFPFICVCGLSAVSSLVAIVTGHLALANIKRVGGPQDGRTQAMIGLILGYLMMVVTIGLWAQIGPAAYEVWQKEEQARANRPTMPKDRLRDAEMRVLTVSTEGTATGNTPEAKSLAADYAEALTIMRRALFTKEQEGMSLTKGNFVVHCEASAKSCVFIVHVPSYRNFSDDAKEELESRAWQMAEEIVSRRLGAGSRLAVGLRGTALYGAVLIGQIGDDDNHTNYKRENREALMEFFVEDGMQKP